MRSVSYTHLDVYKRQVLGLAKDIKAGCDKFSVEEPAEGIIKPVSYTHLDVYKRQFPGRPVRASNKPGCVQILFSEDLS